MAGAAGPPLAHAAGLMRLGSASMPSTKERAWRALSDRLREALPAEAAEAFIGGTHTRRFADNLLPGLSQSQIATLREQLGLGAGNELTATKTGKRRAHAPYSSAALAANAFGRWIGSEAVLTIAGLGGFTERLKVEEKIKIAHGGGTANLDCFLRNDDLVVGIESKLTETLEPHDPVAWKPPYRSSEMESLLDGGWREVFLSSLAGSWQPRHLGVEQLIKHALALNSLPDAEKHLVYLYWEPVDGADHAEVVGHREEVAELVERVGDALPRLHVRTYDELLEEWADIAEPAWLPEHIEQLRERYAIRVPSS